MASNNAYAVTVNASGQIFTVKVFADNTVQAIENAKNQVIGQIGSVPRFTIVSVVPFNPCGAPTTTIVSSNINSQNISPFVASGGKTM